MSGMSPSTGTFSCVPVTLSCTRRAREELQVRNRADAGQGDLALRHADREAVPDAPRVLRDAEDVLAGGAEVRAGEAAGAARALQVAKARLPLDAPLGGLVARDFDDQALDEYLCAAH